MTTHQIELESHLEDFVNELIEQGKYESRNQVILAGLELLHKQEKSESPSQFPGQLVELPNNPSISSLNTFMDDNLQDLMAMLDAQEAEKTP
ncbi:MAG: hypothetical protein GKR96_07900 [Gammaproteobacteria bacterium]|nr:hypothetical protein [Gammaproteobacteria bacterium]